MRKVLTTPPALLPLSEAELDQHCRLAGVQVERLRPYLEAAAEHVATVCDRALLTQTWTAYLDCWPRCSRLELPLGRLQEISAIRYYPRGGSVQTLSSSVYGVSATTDAKSYLQLEYAQAWPSDTLRTVDPIKIEWICGWTAPDLVPAAIRQAIRLLAGQYWEHREQSVVGATAAVTFGEMPWGVQALLANWRLY